MLKNQEKQRALQMRRAGKTYSEILKEIPVAKSTLSLWLREVGLSKKQKQIISEKRLAAALRGAKIKREMRIKRTEKIKLDAVKELECLGKKVFWMVGAALYWAEGSKQKEHNVAAAVIFSNSDSEMIKFFYNWLIKICLIKPEDIYFELYIHENADIERSKKFWAESLKLDIGCFGKVRLKRNISSSFRKNKGLGYNGVLRVVVKRSANFNRKISGWVYGLREQFYKYSGVV